MQFEHLAKTGSVPGYSIKIICSGKCPYLMDASVYESADGNIICYDDSGLTGLKSLLAESYKFRFSSLLSYLRRCAEGLRGLSDYLFKPEYVSLDLDRIYFDSCGKVRFTCPGKDPDPCSALLGLCAQIGAEFPYTNADIIVKKLKDTNSEKLLGLPEIIRVLSLWELELKN